MLAAGVTESKSFRFIAPNQESLQSWSGVNSNTKVGCNVTSDYSFTPQLCKKKNKKKINNWMGKKIKNQLYHGTKPVGLFFAA